MNTKKIKRSGGFASISINQTCESHIVGATWWVPGKFGLTNQ